MGRVIITSLMKCSLWISFCCTATSFADIRVKDYLGRMVVLQSPATRIVALAPHIVENLYSAGAGGLIVGTVDYSDYPEDAKAIPRVGIISAYSLESIVTLRPDLVVVWHSGRGGNVLATLEKLGLTVYASDPRTLRDVPRSIRDFGLLTGNKEIAEASVRLFEERLQFLRERYRHAPSVRTFYQVWNDPMQTLNDRHIVSDVIRLCGGENVFGDAPSLAPRISVESVIQRNPGAIIASGLREERPAWLDDWKAWKSIDAVKLNNLFVVHPDLIQRHTMRILDGAETICKHLQTARGR